MLKIAFSFDGNLIITFHNFQMALGSGNVSRLGKCIMLIRMLLLPVNIMQFTNDQEIANKWPSCLSNDNTILLLFGGDLCIDKQLD